MKNQIILFILTIFYIHNTINSTSETATDIARILSSKLPEKDLQELIHVVEKYIRRCTLNMISSLLFGIIGTAFTALVLEFITTWMKKKIIIQNTI